MSFRERVLSTDDVDGRHETDLALCAGVLAVLSVLLFTALPGNAENPKAMPDQSWVSVSGTVADVSTEEFTLDYGEGLITVEMDHWSWYLDGNPLVPGDRVTAYGRIDDDLFEGKEIVADSIYVAGRATYYYPDDVGLYTPYTVYAYPTTIAPEGSYLTVSGTVEKITGREFVLDLGTGKIEVDTIAMGYNPLDEVGFQRIRKGDRVSVSGVLDLDFFDNRELEADTIVTLSSDGKKKSSSGS